MSKDCGGVAISRMRSRFKCLMELDLPIIGGIILFRVVIFRYLVYPSIGRITRLQVDSGRCCTWPSLGLELSRGNLHTVEYMLGRPLCVNSLIWFRSPCPIVILGLHAFRPLMRLEILRPAFTCLLRTIAAREFLWKSLILGKTNEGDEFIKVCAY